MSASGASFRRRQGSRATRSVAVYVAAQGPDACQIPAHAWHEALRKYEGTAAGCDDDLRNRVLAPVLSNDWRRRMPTLTQSMARAEVAACSPGDPRCYAFPDPLEVARKTCTPKGRCCIGRIVSNGGRDSWDVWLDVHTGEGRLRRREQ